MSFGNNVYNTLNGNSGTSFTPSISFGGASVGITYQTQSGTYHRIGNIVFLRLIIVLTSKGSSTGQARITNLPFNNSGSLTLFNTVVSEISLAANYTAIFTQTESTTNNLLIYSTGDNVVVGGVFDTDFTNDSQIVVTGFYFV